MLLNTHRQTGFTLLEIMIALLILAIGLLGLAHLQITTLKNGQTAEFRSIASQLAFDIFDKMRANQTQRNDDTAYDLSAGTSLGACKNEVSFGNSTPQADKDLICWKEKVTRLLPQGDAAITCESYVEKQPFVCTVTIQWNEPQEDGENDATSSFIYSGAI